MRCRDELAVPGGIHTPDLGVPSQFIKRLPVASSDGQYNGLLRRHSDLPSHISHQLDVPDLAKHKVVWRMSENTPPTMRACDERFKSLSETEMVRRKSSSDNLTDFTRSRSMDALTVSSSSPPKTQHFGSWSPTKILLNDSPLQPRKGVAAKRKLSAPFMCIGIVGGDGDSVSMVDNKCALTVQDLVRPGVGIAHSRNFSDPDVLHSKNHSSIHDCHPSTHMKRAARKHNSLDSRFHLMLSPVSFHLNEEEEENEDLSSGQSTPIQNGNHSAAGTDEMSSGQSTPVDRIVPTMGSSSKDIKEQSGEQKKLQEQSGKDGGLGLPQEQSGKKRRPGQPQEQSGKDGEKQVDRQGQSQPGSSQIELPQPLTVTNLGEASACGQTGPVLGVGKTQSDPTGMPASTSKNARKLSAPPCCGVSLTTPNLKKDSEDLSSGVSTPVKNQGSNEQLNRQADNLTVSTSVMGERGESDS